jgi:hypothetical protein
MHFGPAVIRPSKSIPFHTRVNPMKYRLLLSVVLGGSLATYSVGAQEPQGTPPEPVPPQIDQSRVAAASRVQRSDFVDPGNERARQFAAERGISLGEATSQLRRQAALARFIERLQGRHPDLFSYVSVSGEGIEVGLTDPSVNIQSLIPPGLARVTKVQAVYSEAGTRARLDELREQLRTAGLDNISIGVNSKTGRVEFMTRRHRAEIEQLIGSGAIDLPHGYEVVNDEIVAAASLDAGLSWNVEAAGCNEYCGATTGFSLIDTAGTQRYVSTAGHVDNGRARYHTSRTSTYTSGGQSLERPVEMFNHRLDIQYSRPTSASNFPNPYFYDGSRYVTVENFTYPTEGVEFCKYGRSTQRTCGIHDTVTMYSNTRWNAHYLRKIRNNGGSRFVQSGDSGGPVYYNNWALGWVHGHDSDFNMFYTPVSDFKAVQQAVDLIVYR